MVHTVPSAIQLRGSGKEAVGVTTTRFRIQTCQPVCAGEIRCHRRDSHDTKPCETLTEINPLQINFTSREQNMMKLLRDRAVSWSSAERNKQRRQTGRLFFRKIIKMMEENRQIKCSCVLKNVSITHPPPPDLGSHWRRFQRLRCHLTAMVHYTQYQPPPQQDNTTTTERQAHGDTTICCRRLVCSIRVPHTSLPVSSNPSYLPYPDPPFPSEKTWNIASCLLFTRTRSYSPSD